MLPACGSCGKFEIMGKSDTHSSPAMRPAQRVSEYLDQQLASSLGAEPIRLPTARRLAQELGVSERTVLTVYRQYSSRKLTRTKAGGGTYLVPTAAPAPETIRIGISSQQSNPQDRRSWAGLVYVGIFEEAGAVVPAASVLPMVSVEEDRPRNIIEMLLSHRQRVDGLILFPIGVDPTPVIEAYAQDRKPVVHLNPPSHTATENFVSPDFFGVSRAIVEAFIQAGRKSIVIMVTANQVGGKLVVRGVSNQMRIHGAMTAAGMALGRDVQVHVIAATNASEFSGSEAMEAFLDRGLSIDALYCAGDRLAMSAIEVLQQRGYRVPEDVSVVGGTGADVSDSSWPTLTRVAQPLRETGRALTAMLRRRILQPDKPCPGVFIPTPVVGGSTTRSQENKLLNIPPLPAGKGKR